MKGDFTRLSFKKDKHYRGVLLQQGRVQLDSDWNEQVQIAEYRYSTFFGDFVGQSGTPAENGMVLSVDQKSGEITLSAGRHYVDGLLLENEDVQNLVLPSNEDGLYLVYLDAWSREVTAAEERDLYEQALGGPDTTVRLKTEWCPRLQKIEGLTPNQIDQRYRPKWPEPENAMGWELPLSSGKLTVVSTNVQIMDNRLYRVEVHTGSLDENGKTVQSTFKWSRDNGSVVAPVTTVSEKMILLADANLSIQNAFSDVTLVEVCDLESARICAPGYLGKVDKANSDLSNGKIAIQEWIYGKVVHNELSSKDLTLIVRRWDGVSEKTSFELEGGIKVASKQGYYRNGDYWLIPTRAGSIIEWDKSPQPPNGIEHHFAALGLIDKFENIFKFYKLNMIFQPLVVGNVSKLGDTIDGNLCINGKLGVGFSDKSLLDNNDPQKGPVMAPLSITAAGNGNLLSFLKDQFGAEAWRINQKSGTTPSLSITDKNGNGLTIQEGCNAAISRHSGSPDMVTLSVKSGGGNCGAAILLDNNNSEGRDYLISSYGGKLMISSGAGIIPDLVIDATGYLGLGTQWPQNRLDVDGAMVVGRTYSGKKSASPNGMLVEGNVGIGTDQPATKLDVYGSMQIGTGRNNENHKLVIRGPNSPNNSSSYQDLSFEFAGAGSTKIRAYRGESWDTCMQFLTNPAEAGKDDSKVRMHISDKGKVGIGTVNPQAVLDVAGKIRSQNFRKQVFDSLTCETKTTNFIDIPAMTQDVILNNSMMLIIFKAGGASVHNEPVSGVGPPKCRVGAFRLLIDGDAVAGTTLWFSAEGPDYDTKDVTITWLSDELPPGTHSVKVQWSVGNTGNVLKVCAGRETKSLIVVEL